MSSTKGHSTCSYDSAATATLDGWTITSAAILVNWPTGESVPSGKSVSTGIWGGGFRTDHPWEVDDNCGNVIPSMAVNETFGNFTEHASVTSGWPDPAEGSSTWFPQGEYWFIDSIAADGGGSYVPDPVYTGSGPTYTYNTKLKWATQKWFIGTTTNGSGHQMFDGDVEFYRDHGITKE